MTRCLALLFAAGTGLSISPIHAHQAVFDIYDGTIVLEGRAASFLSRSPIHAHHAVSDVYDDERTIVLEGRVASFLFGNPHSMVHIRVPDGDGGHTWAVEWRAASRLQSLGWTADALHVGDRVRVCGNPGRDPGAYRLYLLNVTRVEPGAPSAADDDPCEPGPPAMRSTGANVRLGPPRAAGR